MRAQAGGLNLMTMDAQSERYLAELERRHRRFAAFLRVRAAFGVAFMLLGAAGFAAAAGIVGVAAGWWSVPDVEPWTRGFGAVLAPGLPLMFGLFAWTTGHRWWVERRADEIHPECACG